jgi:hypothetical protein
LTQFLIQSVRPSASRIVIAILESGRDAEPRQYGSVATAQHALERAMRRIAKSQKRKLSDLHVCYEASGCGFWIARRFLQMGVRCDVIAPSLIPTRSGDRVKTDKRDAAKLAKMLRSNNLVAVHVPDSVDEAIRDLCRARTDAVDDLRRARTRLLALLRQLGYHYDGKTHWTQSHQNYTTAKNKPVPAEGGKSAKLEAESALRDAACCASFWGKGRVWTQGSGDYRDGYLWTAEIDIGRHRGAIQCHAKTESLAIKLRDQIFLHNVQEVAGEALPPSTCSAVSGR